MLHRGAMIGAGWGRWGSESETPEVSQARFHMRQRAVTKAQSLSPWRVKEETQSGIGSYSGAHSSVTECTEWVVQGTEKPLFPH